MTTSRSDQRGVTRRSGRLCKRCGVGLVVKIVVNPCSEGKNFEGNGRVTNISLFGFQIGRVAI